METITITVAEDRLSKLKEMASDFDVTLEELVRLRICPKITSYFNKRRYGDR